MVKEGNVRFTITMSEEQVKWLDKCAKTMKCSRSKAIRWLISKNAISLAAKTFYTREEFDELVRIARTPWIDDENDEDIY